MNHQADFPDMEPAHRLLVTEISADHATLAHKGQFRKDCKTPYITHPIRVAGLVGIFNGSHVAVSWLHDVYEDCTPEWILKMDELIVTLLLPDDDGHGDTVIIKAMSRKNTI